MGTGEQKLAFLYPISIFFFQLFKNHPPSSKKYTPLLMGKKNNEKPFILKNYFEDLYP